MNDLTLEALFTLHRGLPREGPGSDASTREALRRLPSLPDRPIILDLGCGPGRQTLVLARELNARVIAVDLHAPYLETLKQSAVDEGLSHLIDPRLGDIGALAIEPRSIDLIWSEGAAYVLGFQEALRRWKPLLTPVGAMALTECSWLTDSPADEAKAFWDVAYPAMGTIAVNCRRAAEVGLRVVDTFTLPASAWWDDYYTPLLARIEELRPSADAALRGVIEETEREIELFRNHQDCYGYLFYVLV